MATGLPCLVTPFLGISEGIGKVGEHYLLVERDGEAIASQMLQLLDNETTARSLADRGARFVADNLDQQLSLDHYAALYQELAHLAERRR